MICSAIRSLLIRLARILSGEQLSNVSAEPQSEKLGPIDSASWNFFEVVAMLRAKERAGQLDPGTIRQAYDAIQAAADSTELSLIQRKRPDLKPGAETSG